MINADLKNANILIVDDQQANIDVLEGLLEMQGYNNFKSTTDPRDVFHYMKSFQPDLILLDLMMPHLNGFQVMEQIKLILDSDAYLPILVLTADITTETKKRALSDGAMDFLVKPFDVIEVGLRIKNLLETRFLHQQYANRNKILDQKVKERTKELEQINRDLVSARDQAEASNRLKTSFMHNISHEVRTPLNGIIGFGSLLADPDIPAEEKNEFIPLLQASSHRLINTITEYMDISLIASGNYEMNYHIMNVNKELVGILEKYKPLCNARKLELNLEVPANSDGFVISTDPEIFRKIVNHLVDNAIKFTHHGGVTFGYTNGTNSVDFFVRDTGIGIASDAYEKIFEIFMQEDVSDKRGYEGSGLGLSVAKGFLDMLHGQVRVESVKGEGSTFFFTIPQEKLVAEPVEDNSPPIRLVEGVLPVILIADDEYSNLVYMELALQKHASTILLANNGKEALDLCRDHPEISFVLMDMKMPVMNGFEATREIRKIRKDLPIFAVTAYAMSGDEQRSIESGCSGYFSKPFDKLKLLGALKSYGLTT